ncbi:MAG: DUF1015 domain-containing protein [Tenericutes bacterium HGW-Tenericutes-3]|nr:MAG: DUF1015 domain-containing protein [Tenericutes bacterium HGW-Tenericutes-3]
MSLYDVKHPIVIPEIYLPNELIDLGKWAVVACDQFTSQPSYWNKLKEMVENIPSTYHLILPEVYLEKMNNSMISKINQTMEDYIDKDYLKSIGPSMILVERTTIKKKRRLGLIMSIDLETYDYQEHASSLIRATEKTIIERIPPRVKIRQKAYFELSHVMLLVDDKEEKIIETLYQQKESYPKLYDFELNMNGGHIRGYQIKDCQDIINKFSKVLIGDKNPILFLAGDGNHSLATAKEHWENIKKGLTPEEQINHPARFTLVEVVNVYDEGLDFEGIHRVLFNVNDDFLVQMFHAVDKEVETSIYTQEIGKAPFFIPENAAKAYEQIQSFIDEYIAKHKDVTIDYVHGEEELIEICQSHPKSVGIIMPCIQRESLFPYIQEGKVLPRKSFSMGCATAKRYYLESKFITYHKKSRGDK